MCPVDTTLITILALLVLATVLAIVRARRRDRCLRALDGFPITMAEQDGDLTWGRACVFATGLEIEYPQAVTTRGGHLERSFIFYKDQFSAMEALYRCADGLTDEEHERREQMIERTANPGLVRRMGRWIRNWMGMVRDALVQAVGLIIGVAKSSAPGAAVFSSQEQNVKALSGEIIGHTGNAFDPLLERHLFTQVVVEVTVQGTKRSYCGWLKDYTSEFVEVLDAYANTPDTTPRPVQPYAPGDERLPHVDIRVEDGRLHVTNNSERVFYLARVASGDWQQPMDTVLPPGYTADTTLPLEADPAAVRLHAGTTDRVDMVVPRRHALVRHAAGGSEDTYRAHRQHLQAERAAAKNPPKNAPEAPTSERSPQPEPTSGVSSSG